MEHTKAGGRRTHKIAAVLLALFLFLGLLGQSSLAVHAEEEEQLPTGIQPYNIVLLIDKSGSMNTTDEGHLAVSAAGMFVNSLYTESLMNQVSGTQGEYSKVGVISFSADAQTEAEPMELSSETEVDYITDRIDSIEYDAINTGATDLGRAVLAGTDMLKETQDDTRQNMIILFTDGYTDALSDEGMVRSSAMMTEGLEAAKQMNCEIYVVGLNYQGRISAEGRAEIWNIANSTQSSEGLLLPDSEDTTAASRVNYLITDSRQEVNAFYADIFSKMMGSTGITLPPEVKDGWTYYNIDLSNPGIFCANIFIVSEGGIGDLTLTDPNGNPVDLQNTEGIRYVRDNGYAMITLMAPESGVWVMATQGEVSYDVTLVPITGLVLQMDANVIGDSADLTVTAVYNDEPQTGAFYTGLTNAVCTVTPEGGGESQTYSLSYSESRGALWGSITVPSPGRYVVEASVSASQMVRSAVQTLEFSMEGSPIYLTVGQNKSISVNFQQMFLTGWDSVELKADSVVCDPEDAIEVTTDGSNMITVRGLSVGEATFTIHATDNFGQEWDIPGNVEVTVNMMLYLPFILLALVVLVVLLVLLYKRTRRLPGEFSVVCSCGAGYSVESVRPPRGSSFTLYELVFSSLDPETSNPDLRSLVSAVESARKELSSNRYRIYITVRTSGRKKYTTYRYGNDHRALGGEIYRNDDTGLRIEVDFHRPDEDSML